MEKTRKKPKIIKAKDKVDFIVRVTFIIENVNKVDRKSERRKMVYAIIKKMFHLPRRNRETTFFIAFKLFKEVCAT